MRRLTAPFEAVPALPRLATRCVALGMALPAVVAALSARAANAAELAATRHEGGVRIEVDGTLFADYLINTGPKPILWPVIGPTGVEMTRAYPMRVREGEKQDHPHQRSMWFTHGSVNGVDFWSENAGHGSIIHREFLEVSAGGSVAVIAARNDWIGPDGTKHCEDERRLVFSSGDDWRAIDFEITLRASERAVVFGDTKEGTFGLRVPTVMDVTSGMGGRIVNSQGQTNEQAWGQAAAWVDYHGPVGGEVVGVAILNHPSSFRFPTTWHVRTYGLFAANPFGLSDFRGTKEVDGSYRLEAGESFTLRYRVLLHRGDEQEGKVAEAFAAYAQEKFD